MTNISRFITLGIAFLTLLQGGSSADSPTPPSKPPCAHIVLLVAPEGVIDSSQDDPRKNYYCAALVVSHQDKFFLVISQRKAQFCGPENWVGMTGENMPIWRRLKDVIDFERMGKVWHLTAEKQVALTLLRARPKSDLCGSWLISYRAAHEKELLPHRLV